MKSFKECIVCKQLNEYLKAAEMFPLNLMKILNSKKLHEQVKNFEYLVSQLCFFEIDSIKSLDSKILRTLALSIHDGKFFKRSFEELVILSHNLKGLARGMDERELSDTIHRFEGGLSLFQENFNEVKREDWEDFFKPLDDQRIVIPALFNFR